MNKPEFSLCAIYKNEEKNLKIFLDRHKDLFDEFILVDTGSTDKSTDIVKSYGFSYYFFKWINDFSKARNFSLSKATKEFIIVLDLDEWLTPQDFERLKVIIQETRKDVYSLQQINFMNTSSNLNWKSIHTLPKFLRSYAKGYITSPLFRVFRNIEGICFNGIIHELIGESVHQLNLSSNVTDIPIYHFGWIETGRTPKEQAQKQKSYNNLIKTAWEEDRSPKMFFYYINSLSDPNLKIKLTYPMTKKHSDIKQFWEILADCTIQLSQWDRAMSYINKGLTFHPENPILLYNKAICLNYTSKPDQAVLILSDLLKSDPWNLTFLGEKIKSLILLKNKKAIEDLLTGIPKDFPIELYKDLIDSI